MTEINLDDEDFVIIVVGDDDEDTQLKREQIKPVGVKVEPKEEIQYEENSGDENGDEYKEYIIPDMIKDADTKYEFEADCESMNSFDEDSLAYDDLLPYWESNYKPRKSMVEPDEAVSFVAELREDFPEFARNEDLLVEHLVEIMRKVRVPPPLPPIKYKVKHDDKYRCLICNKITDTDMAADRHFQWKHGPRYLRCFACGVDFRCTTNLYKHEKRCCSPDAQIVLKARGRFLGRKGKSRPFLTQDTFILKEKEVSKLRIIHNKKIKKIDKKYQCEHCPSRFADKTALQTHQNKHLGLKPFQCNICPAAYTSNGTLQRHMAMHSDQSYVCDICNKSFKLKTRLASHMDIHREPKYECELCSRRFVLKFGLKRHVEKIHVNPPQSCECRVCSRSFYRMSHLKTHMKRKHGLILMTPRMLQKHLPTIGSQEQRALVVYSKNKTS